MVKTAEKTGQVPFVGVCPKWLFCVANKTINNREPSRMLVLAANMWAAN